MPPDPVIDDDEAYASSEDSDFAPDAAPERGGSDDSGSEDDGEEPTTTTTDKQRPKERGPQADDAGYDNSGDEAIIEKGRKRRKRNKTKDGDGDGDDDDEGGEGGLIKTRRQRAAEKAERKFAASTGPVTVDVDAIWAQMQSGQPTKQSDPDQTTEQSGARDADAAAQATQPPTADEDPSALVRIKRTYNFAGRVHTEEKLVARDSAEARLFFASQAGEGTGAGDLTDSAAPAKRGTKKAFRSAFEPITDPIPQRADLNLGMQARMQAGREAQAAAAKKLNTVEKSRMDWAGYVDKEGIKDELELAGKSKDSYAAREDFLARSEARREEDARRARLGAAA